MLPVSPIAAPELNDLWKNCFVIHLVILKVEVIATIPRLGQEHSISTSVQSGILGVLVIVPR